MSKTYIIISFFLLLVSCSDYKVKKAIENCADQKFMQSSTVSMYASWNEIPKIKSIKQKIKSLENLKTSKEKEVKDISKKFAKNNPYPKFKKMTVKMPIAGSSSFDKDFKAYKEARKKIRDDFEKETNLYSLRKMALVKPVYEEITNIEKDLKNFNWQLKQSKLFIIREKFKKMNSNEKAKVAHYIELYGVCEYEYKDLPNKFLMQYK